MTTTCALSAPYEEMLAFMDVVAQETERRMEFLKQQREQADREISSLNSFAEFAATLRRQVEAGQIPVEAALVELFPRHFNTSELISNLHEFKQRRKAS